MAQIIKLDVKINTSFTSRDNKQSWLQQTSGMATFLTMKPTLSVVLSRTYSIHISSSLLTS